MRAVDSGGQDRVTRAVSKRSFAHRRNRLRSRSTRPCIRWRTDAVVRPWALRFGRLIATFPWPRKALWRHREPCSNTKFYI